MLDLFTSAMISETVPTYPDVVHVGMTVLMPCGGLLKIERREFYPESREVGLFAGMGERYLFDQDHRLELVIWEGANE